MRAPADGTPARRGACIDSSDQTPNPHQSYDLWAGTGLYRWPTIDDHSWRDRYGTFEWRKDNNDSHADLKAKYDLWVNTQDAPHGIYDLDGDGLRDAFIGASVSGGPADIYEVPGRALPVVWHTLERFWVRLGAPGQMNFNLDFSPYKRQRPDRMLSREIKTFTDKWGNKLERFAGAFSVPEGWDGKAVSPYDLDSTPAKWMSTTRGL